MKISDSHELLAVFCCLARLLLGGATQAQLYQCTLFPERQKA